MLCHLQQSEMQLHYLQASSKGCSEDTSYAGVFMPVYAGCVRPDK